MLNKNQSKKRNYWKYYAVIPALLAFVLLFQIKTIAQEKKEVQKVSEKITSVDVYKIKSTTTDQELKEVAQNLKKNHDVNVEISEVRRNAANELINIKVEIEKGTGKAQTIQIEGNNAIKDCGIIVSTEDNGSKKINLITDGAVEEQMFEDRKIEVRELKNKVGEVTPPVPPTPPTMPVFPSGPMPPAPPVDMSKMPKAPKAPTNINDKAAMKNFEKEMTEFEKKMQAFEPDMSAYEKQVEEIMGQREAIYDKEMEKYDLAMEKFDADMEKFNQYIEKTYGSESEEYTRNMGEYEKGIQIYQKYMRQQEKDMRKAQKNKKS